MGKAKTSGNVLRSEQHQAAIDEYEKGIRLVQQRDYTKAIPRFEAVIENFPNEAALCDRARTYLAIANQEADKKQPLESTREPELSYEVGVYLLNNGQAKEAQRHLERAVEHDGANEGALLALASANVMLDDRPAALESLGRVLDRDATARFRIKSMSDFDALAGDEEFQALLASKA
ncbi:MAG: tetratricopeptide repeat protein [Acidobacteriota bacterium]